MPRSRRPILLLICVVLLPSLLAPSPVSDLSEIVKGYIVHKFIDLVLEPTATFAGRKVWHHIESEAEKDAAASAYVTAQEREVLDRMWSQRADVSSVGECFRVQNYIYHRARARKAAAESNHFNNAKTPFPDQGQANKGATAFPDKGQANKGATTFPDKGQANKGATTFPDQGQANKGATTLPDKGTKPNTYTVNIPGRGTCVIERVQAPLDLEPVRKSGSYFKPSPFSK